MTPLIAHAHGCRPSSARISPSMALFVAATIVTIGRGPAMAQVLPQGHPSATTRSAGTIDERIQQALAQSGSVDALATALGAAGRTDPAVLDADARVALEQGDLSRALVALRDRAAVTPAEPMLLRRIASVEEKLGQTGPAEVDLKKALGLLEDRSVRVDVRLHLALLAFDDGRAGEGVRWLDEACADEPSTSATAGVIAYLYGQYDVAARLIGHAAGEARPTLKLLQGNAALRAGQVHDATAAFDAALHGVTDADDRRYAQERVVAAARLAGTLPKLADAWLADPRLPPEQLLQLAGVLNELGRVPELLNLWRQGAADPRRAATVLTSRFINEVINAAHEAGLTERATAAARELLALKPDDERLLSAVLLMTLNDGKPTEADALLAGRVTASAAQPEVLLRLAKLSRSLGRDDVAIQAARAMEALGGGNAVQGTLLEASVRLRAGDAAAGTALLRSAASAAKGHPAELREVATALEAAGQGADAVSLLQECVRETPDEATSERLASLLLLQRRYADATPILRGLRERGGSPAVRAQAGQRLLDIAVANGTVPQMVDATRAALQAGTGTEADLALLVDAYARSNNAAAAADALISNTLLERKVTLSRLAVLYLRTGNLTKASEALRDLVTADPENAVGTLERLASVQLDHKEPKAAAATLDEIADRIGRGSTSFSALMGGIYDRLNRPAQAAPFYRRVLANNPQNADEWLLWATAAAKAGKPSEAVGRLLVLCDEAKAENVFSVAVDGLLNLKAPPAALRAARRGAILRAAAATHNTMLYQVIGDLSDELQDGDGVVRAVEVSVPIDREGRPQLLRELMDKASSSGLLDEANACGRTMLALDDDFPPQLFIELGEKLLIAGRVRDALRAFSRASEVGSDEQVAPRAADLFEQYGSPELALRVLTPLAERKRTQLSLRQTLARLYELSGQTAMAFDAYMSAIPLADRELAALPQGPTPADKVPPPRPDLAGIVNGAIATGRTPEQKQRLLDELEGRARREFEATAPAATSSPAFLLWIGELRHASFAVERPDVIDRVEEELITRRPDVKSLVRDSLATRIDQGLFASAVSFAHVHGLQGQLPVNLRLSPPDDVSPATERGPIAVDEAAVRLPRLLILGRTQEAEQLLRSVPVAMPAKPFESVPTLIAAAVAVGDEDVANRWAAAWARQIDVEQPTIGGGSGPTPAVTGAAISQLRYMVQSVWRILPAAARTEITHRAIELSDRSEGTANATAAATLALQLAASEGMDIPHNIEVALRISPQRKSDAGAAGAASELASRFMLVPASCRAEFVSRAIDKLPAASGLLFLERIVDNSIEPFDAKTNAAIVAAAERLPDWQTLIWSTWFLSTQHRSLVPALADATLRATAKGGPGDRDVASKVAAAVALADGEPDKAERTAVGAVRELLAAHVEASSANAVRGVSPSSTPATTPPAYRLPAGMGPLIFARYAATVIRADARMRLIDAIAESSRTHGLTPAGKAWRLAITSVLLDSAGRREEAAAALRQAFNADTDDADIRQAWVDRMRQDGRAAELAATFVASSPQLPRNVVEPLAVTLRSLFRGREVPLPAKSVGVSAITPRRVLDFMSPRSTNDHVKLAETLRMFLERLRTNPDGLSPIVEADPGGQPADDSANGYRSLFSDLGQWPGSIDDLLGTLCALPQGRPVADRLTEILCSAASDPAVAAQLISRLTAAQRAEAISTNDRMLIERLALRPDVKLPPELVDEIWNDVLFDPTGDPDVRRLAECLRVQGDPRAAHLQLWATVRSQVTNPTRSILASRNTTRMLPTPVSASDLQGIAARVRLLLDENQVDAVEKEL